MNADERETVINATDADETIRIWTAQPRFLNKLRKDPRFTETKSGRVDGTETAEFTIPAYDWNPVTGAKRRSGMTNEQKQVSAARLAAWRGGLSTNSPHGASEPSEQQHQTHTLGTP